ncbi:hypothetical protein HK100_004795 [Physocladia obscura]|uniref:Uncharacterized protein n=1 Tax=Physocladia obscura TaxID=109957 RepID=A0AAD5SV77_9FUNG|nr:hypothetical protein HK100_004795 [Physocladia obscura]
MPTIKPRNPQKVCVVHGSPNAKENANVPMSSMQSTLKEPTLQSHTNFKPHSLLSNAASILGLADSTTLPKSLSVGSNPKSAKTSAGSKSPRPPKKFNSNSNTNNNNYANTAPSPALARSSSNSTLFNSDNFYMTQRKDDTTGLSSDAIADSKLLSPADIVTFIESLKYLVALSAGDVEVSQHQIGVIRTAVFSFYDIIYEETSDFSATAIFCSSSLAPLLANLHAIQRYSVKTTAPQFHSPTPTEINSIFCSITRAFSLINAHHANPAEPVYLDTRRLVNKIVDDTIWPLQYVFTILVAVLADDLAFAAMEGRKLAQRFESSENRVSVQTLVNDFGCGNNGDLDQDFEDLVTLFEKINLSSASPQQDSLSAIDSKGLLNEPVKIESKYKDFDVEYIEKMAGNAFIVYTGKTDAFISKQTSSSATRSDSKQTLETLMTQSSRNHNKSHKTTDAGVKTAIARISANALTEGDALVVLSGWSGDDNDEEVANDNISSKKIQTLSPPQLQHTRSTSGHETLKKAGLFHAQSSFVPTPPSVVPQNSRGPTNSFGHLGSTNGDIVVCAPNVSCSGSSGGTRAFAAAEKLVNHKFKTVSLARLDGVKYLSPGYSRLTVTILTERADVDLMRKTRNGWHDEIEKIEMLNRVKDALKYGAIRIDKDLVALFF